MRGISVSGPSLPPYLLSRMSWGLFAPGESDYNLPSLRTTVHSTTKRGKSFTNGMGKPFKLFQTTILSLNPAGKVPNIRVGC